MNVLVLGATGATGRWAVTELLANGHNVVALVRDATAMKTLIKPSTQLTIIEKTALTIALKELTKLVCQSDAIICCLGHTLSWKGIYGAPRMLVKSSLQRVCECVTPERKTTLRVVLMNSTGCRNLDEQEPVSLAQHAVLGLLRLLLPPHVDNERAGNYLRLLHKRHPELNHLIEWVVVRPDALIDDRQLSEYTLHPSPIRSALFDSGKTSRINAGHFMANLVVNDTDWQQWKGKMPVIYNNG